MAKAKSVDLRGEMRRAANLLEGDRRAAATLFRRYASATDGKTRRIAGESFGRESRKTVTFALPMLWEYSSDADENVRWTTALALGEMGVADPGAVLPKLKELADDASWSVRESAASALICIQLRHSDIVSTMAQWAHDRKPNVRRAVAESLGRGLGKKQPDVVLSILNQMVCDSSLYVRKAVGNACRNMSKGYALAVLATLKSWADLPQVEARWTAADGALDVACEIPRSSFPILRKLAADPEQTVRTRVRAALKKAIASKPDEAISLLRKWERDRDAGVREMAAGLLENK